MEKIKTPMSGFLALLISILLFIAAIYFFVNAAEDERTDFLWYGSLSLAASIFLGLGIIVVNPNHSRVLIFFGKYVGTVKENGLLFVNPFFKKQKISLRAENLESSRLKVNDKMGNPIEIAAVIVWQVKNTYNAAFEV